MSTGVEHGARFVAFSGKLSRFKRLFKTTCLIEVATYSDCKAVASPGEPPKYPNVAHYSF